MSDTKPTPVDAKALVKELRQLATIPTKVTQITRANLFGEAADLIEAFVLSGWSLVPEEPTTAMIDAGLFADQDSITDIWFAMVGAVPQPTTASGLHGYKLGVEDAAKVCEDAEGTAHPSDLADAIRALTAPKASA